MPRPTTALIVDDEEHVRTYLRLVLRELGIAKTWEAPDGVKGVEMVNAHDPELVLLDLNMPLMTGLEVLEEIQKGRPDLPVIVATSLSSTRSVQDALRLGAIGYVLKQSPKAELVAAIRDALDRLEPDDGAAADANA
jgi:two-component system chemotaxis response regulator CheY